MSVDVPHLFYPENTLKDASKIECGAFNPNLLPPGLGLGKSRFSPGKLGFNAQNGLNAHFSEFEG